VWGASPCRPMEGKTMDSLHLRGCWPSASVTAAMVDGAATSGGAPNRSHRCCRATSTEWWCCKRRPAELQSPTGRAANVYGPSCNQRRRCCKCRPTKLQPAGDGISITYRQSYHRLLA
jgi:hypothetical protein